MEFLLAMQFLSLIPITIKGNVQEKNLARSMAFYPAVGIILGLVAAGLYTALRYAFAISVCDLAVVSFFVFVTGNMHGDALMDTTDGFFSGKPRDRVLEIMKDSRVGSHGVMAGCLSLLGKFVLLGQIPSLSGKVAALIVAPTLGRWALVYGSALYPYARGKGGGTGGFTEMVGKRELFWASLTALVTAVLLLGINGLITSAATLGTVILLNKFVCYKLGGVTGDTLGATNECVELLVYALIPVLLKISWF